MTREELKVHCEKQIKQCEMWAKYKGENPSGKVYEEHQLILELLEQESEWIPMTTRPMTEEEKDRYRERLEYVDDAVIFNCPLPDDGQEVLITVYGETELDTFYNDSVDGCYFENRDIDDVDAWMPKPKPYKPQKVKDKK